MPESRRAARLAIVTEIIAPYRVPVFNRLAERLGRNVLALFMSESGGREWTVPLSRLHFPYRVMRGIRFIDRRAGAFPRYLNLGVVGHLARFRPTVTIIVGYHHLTSFVVWWYAKLSHSKLYLLCESHARDRRSGRLVTEAVKTAFIRACDGYIVPGTASATYLKSYGADPRRIFFAPNSIDTEAFPTTGAADEAVFRREREAFRRRWDLVEFNLLFVGRLAPEKGVDVALDVVKRLQVGGTEVGLVLVGDGPERRALERMAGREGIRHAAFVGFKQPEELTFYYQCADLLIHPARSEPWGLVLNEAMSCGLPVLCSPNVGAASDLVVQGKTGYVCESMMDYVGAIRELHRNPARRVAMSAACRTLMERFSPDLCAQGFLEALEAAGSGGVR